MAPVVAPMSSVVAAMKSVVVVLSPVVVVVHSVLTVNYVVVVNNLFKVMSPCSFFQNVHVPCHFSYLESCINETILLISKQ